MGKRKTVLVVDDSAALLDALTAAFEEAGYDVATAVDGEEVFRKMATTDPDALLLDHGDAHPRARAVERGGIPARTTTEDDEVEVVRHLVEPPLVERPCRPGSWSFVHQDDLEGERNQDHDAGERREHDVCPGTHCKVEALKSVRLRSSARIEASPKPRGGESAAERDVQGE